MVTELILGDDGASTSGKFLIRSKGKSNDEFILSVIYKKSATHHTVAREGAGEEFKVNKQPSDGATTLEAVRVVASTLDVADVPRLAYGRDVVIRARCDTLPKIPNTALPPPLPFPPPHPPHSFVANL